MANANTELLTRVVIPCRLSFAHIWEPASINGSNPKYSACLIVPKADQKTRQKIDQAIANAKERGKSKKWGGKIPATLHDPIHDGDEERPDDESFNNAIYFNANSSDAPQIVDRHKKTITDPMSVYSGCYCNVSVNFYAYSAGGNRGVAAGLGNIQLVADGERLAGRSSASSDFDDLGDDNSEDALSDLPDYLQ